MPELPHDPEAVVEGLLDRMRGQGDFPALSATLAEINAIAISETGSLGRLADAILKDFALTQRLLKLVNAAWVARYGGGVSTISRAVVILGFGTVRDVAATLMVLEELGARAKDTRLRERLASTLFRAAFGRALARHAGMHDAEEAFIACLFHDLGRLLVAFYLPEEAAEIDRRIAAGEREPVAARDVLGIAYAALGERVVAGWRFPSHIVAAMTPVVSPVGRPGSGERLSWLASAADAVTRAVADPARRDPPVAAAAAALRAWSPFIKISTEELEDALAEARSLLRGFSGVLELPTGVFVGGGRVQEPAAAADVEIDRIAIEPPDSAPAEPLLAAGTRELMAALAQGAPAEEALGVAAEVLFRGLPARRVAVFVARGDRMVRRAALGPPLPVAEFALTGPPDVVRVVLAKKTDVFVSDVDALGDRLPAWLRRAAPPAFLLLPTPGAPPALLYIELAERVSQVPRGMLADIRTLRDQIALILRMGAG